MLWLDLDWLGNVSGVCLGLEYTSSTVSVSVSTGAAACCWPLAARRWPPWGGGGIGVVFFWKII